MRKPPNPHGPKAEMNVVPYIDVMLVLLVIFMVTAPLLVQGVPLHLPKVAAEALPADTRAQVITLSVKADGTCYWNLGTAVDVAARTDEAADLAVMTARVGAIMAARPDTKLFIRADKDASYAAVVAAMAALQRAGVENIGLITEAPP
ncbi:protein TolR [Zavarzinia compransoris]|uniref:Tol-Pal system protein TolR n=1 Tax=Zavarzinia compransoris TaxID=1264899 RepID=A0A317E6A7_9PROT|nr:protein TolR [Zavarzinia compransoris]PWR20923.1 protein TolR [Zavarzinia compransoris]TDP44239.1 cell division and transport-associated protein TolR [Zavarzinia compransoris]